MIPILVSLGFLVLSSYLDIKTREIPDKITHTYILTGIAYQLIYAIYLADIYHLAKPIFAGLIFYAYSAILYHFQQWGGADGKLLIGLGIWLANIPSFLPVFFVMIYLVAFFYSTIYAIYLALITPNIFQDLKSSLYNAKFEMTIVCSLFAFLLITAIYLDFIPLLGFACILPLFYLLLKFVKVVENRCFKVKRKVSELVEYDLLTHHVVERNGKLQFTSTIQPTDHVIVNAKNPDGLSKDQLKYLNKLVKMGKLPNQFVIKWGIAFVPVFLIALILTFLVPLQTFLSLL
jgi:Flp pilus assembly protein protease CpaA